MESIVLRFYPLSEWVACFRSSDSEVRYEVREREKNKEEERRGKEEGNFALTPYPTPSLFFFSAHISLLCPHDLTASNRLGYRKGVVAWMRGNSAGRRHFGFS